MDWKVIGERIRQQREYIGYTREQFAELLEISTKFCSDIELGVKGMSIPTLCRVTKVLHLSTDYILFGTESHKSCDDPFCRLVSNMPDTCRPYAEQLVKTLLMAVSAKKEE